MDDASLLAIFPPSVLEEKENPELFDKLVEHCNDYRDKLHPPIPHLDENSKMGLVSCLYAAYTHHDQIQVCTRIDIKLGIKCAI